MNTQKTMVHSLAKELTIGNHCSLYKKMYMLVSYQQGRVLVEREFNRE